MAAVGLKDQLELAVTRLADGRIETQPDGMFSLKWSARLLDPWTPDRIDLFALFPAAYPAQAPSGFDAMGTPTVASKQPGGSGVRSVNGLQCTHFCWNPSGQIDYTETEGAWRFAKFCELRFRELQ